jgi:hypothetical protein
MAGRTGRVCPTAQPSTHSRWRREKKVRKLQQDTVHGTLRVQYL